VTGVLLTFLANLYFQPAIAAVPTPTISLTAAASKISGANWTNDGSIGGTATLSTANTPAPTFQSSDTSVALNSTANTKQFVTQSVGNSSALSSITFEITMKVPPTQANSSGQYGMVMGWTGVNYDIWMQNNNCIGFNTGTGDIYGFNISPFLGSFHTYTFVMSTTAANQKAYVNGVSKSLAFCNGTSAGGVRGFGSIPSTFAIGRYGSNEFYGSLNVRSFKLWLSDIGASSIQESYNATLAPTSHSIALTSGLTTATYRSASTIRSTVDFDGKVTFYSNGKKIPGCVNVVTSSKVANCNWRPNVKNYNFISAVLTTVGGNLTSQSVRVFVNKRATQR
jgi:hypothetical protein